MLKAEPFDYGRIVAGFGVVVCCALLMLSVPRFIASLYALYPGTVIKQADEDKLPPQVYEKCAADLQEALNWYENPDYWQSQAICYLSLLNAAPPQSAEEEQALLKQAQTSIMQGLKLSPIDPYVWFRLAAVDQMLQTPTPQIINALRLSFYSGRVEPELLMLRLSFSYDYYDEFNEEMQQLWQKQIPLAWTFQPAQLVEFAAFHPEAQPIVDNAFVYSPDDFKKFSLALEIYLKKNSFLKEN